MTGAGGFQAPLTTSIAIVVPFAVVPLVSCFTHAPEKTLPNKAFEGV
jgi:SSS family solute:Na+ symporter